MTARAIADAIVLAHAAFIAWACLGGLLAWRHPAWALAHVPAVAWAALVEFTGSICPLTPLENHWRRLAGASGYDGGFVERYLIALVYPPGLASDDQVWLGAGVVALNAAIYAIAIHRWRARRQATIA